MTVFLSSDFSVWSVARTWRLENVSGHGHSWADVTVAEGSRREMGPGRSVDGVKGVAGDCVLTLVSSSTFGNQKTIGIRTCVHMQHKLVCICCLIVSCVCIWSKGRLE